MRRLRMHSDRLIKYGVHEHSAAAFGFTLSLYLTALVGCTYQAFWLPILAVALVAFIAPLAILCWNAWRVQSAWTAALLAGAYGGSLYFFPVTCASLLLSGWREGPVVFLLAYASLALLIGAYALSAAAVWLVVHKLFVKVVISSRRFCRECDYDLTGNVSGVCPECGTPAPRG